MIVPFRQGVIRYPVAGNLQFFLQPNGNMVDLLTGNGVVEVAIAHGQSDYLISENVSIPAAWGSFTPSTNYWLYWDIDLKTGVRTFGSTEIAPIASSVQPPAINDQHWFDLVRNIMFVYQNNVWRTVARAFAAKYNGITLQPLGSGIPAFPYAGTQIGVNVSSSPGRILFDDTATPIKRANGQFITTENQFFTPGSRVNAVRLESNVALVRAGEPIPSFHVIKYTNTGARLAEYADTGNEVLAMSTEEIPFGEVDSVIIQGIVTNPVWNFPTIGAPLWVGSTGVLELVDPNTQNNLLFPFPRVPVARVLSSDTIIFEQGLGGKGEKGDAGDVSGIVSATTLVEGIVRITTGNNVVVSTDDIRMTDARTPLPHTHAATDVSLTPYGDIVASNVQAGIQELDDEKVAIGGDTMTGFLTLNANPTDLLHAATKDYVDGVVSGLSWVDPVHYVNVVGDDIIDPSTITPNVSDVYIVAPGATGAWLGLDGKFVIWDGVTWIEDSDVGAGLVSNHTTGLRIVVSGETASTPTGTFAGRKNQIGTLDDPNIPTWVFTIPDANEATFVNNDDSLHPFHQFVYDGENSAWVEFGGTQSIQPGANLTQSGNILDVRNFSNGGTVDAMFLQGLQPSAFALAAHTQPATSITTVPYAGATTGVPGTTSTNAQLAINELVDNKASLTPIYATQAAFPPAATVHGMIAHSDADQAMFFSHGGAWVELSSVSHVHAIPYDMAFFISGLMVQPDLLVGSFVVTRNVNITAPAAESIAVARIAPLSTVVYDIQQSGVSVGSVSFLANNTVGTVNIAISISLVAGDVLQLFTPAITEPNISDVTITIVGCSIATSCS